MRAKFVNEAIKHLTPRSEEELSKLPKINIEEFKEYFDKHYRYIQNDLSDREIEEFLNRDYVKNLSITRAADLFSDYLLANGAYAQE